MDCTRVPPRSITLINDRQTIAALSGEARDPDSWIPSHLRGGGATASTMPLRALENQQGSSNCCVTDALLPNTRGGNPQLLSCKVSGRSRNVCDSCRRPDLEEKAAHRAISSHEVPSEVQALTKRAACLGAHNPDCDSCLRDWLTGMLGGSLWSCHVSLDRGV